MYNLKLQLRLTIRTAFHTTGNRLHWGVDKALAKSATGQYVIPATTLKGILRDRAEAVLRVWGHPVCSGPKPEDMCADSKALCLVCQFFGHPGRPSPLRFSDGQFSRDIGTQIRSGVSISRQRRAALAQRLFFIETTEPGPLTCLALCEGYFPQKDQAYQAAALITLASRWINAIGSGRTRGLGWLKQIELESKLDDNPINPSDLEKIWNEWASKNDVA